MEEDKIKEDEEVYRLTPWGCLYAILMDYNVEGVEKVSARMGEHMVQDFINLLIAQGYLEGV